MKRPRGVYAVVGESGAYGDGSFWVARVFATKVSADRWCARANQYLKDRGAHDSKVEAGTFDEDLVVSVVRRDIDPFFQADRCYGSSYKVQGPVPQGRARR